jgi:hypothetical protein
MRFRGPARGALDENAGAASPENFAQVGEWLKPTDCKSVPPSEVRRFESFPVHQNSASAGFHVNRLALALIAYVALGALTYLTISDSRIRAATLAILALFAVKSVLRRKDLIHRGKSDDDEVESKDLAEG